MGNCPLTVSALCWHVTTMMCDRNDIPSIVSKGELRCSMEVTEVMLILVCIRSAELQVTVGC